MAVLFFRVHNETNCGKDRNYLCDQCKSTFATVHALKAHLLIHSGVKKNLCGFCGADFISKGQLKVHERSHTGKCIFLLIFEILMSRSNRYLIENF